MSPEKNKPTQQIEDLMTEVVSWQKNNPTATLTQIEEMIDKKLAKLRKQLVETAFVENEEESVLCPNCNKKMASNGRKKRQLQIKGGGIVQFERKQKRCLQCGETIFPPR